MPDFFTYLTEYSFLQNAVIAGLLSGIACGITGVFVYVKKMSSISGGMAHTVMGGLGIAYFFNLNPILGALVFAIFAAFIIGFVKINLKQNEDTIISALWAIGMAVGIIFTYLTPGYNVQLLSFLFGNILLVTTENLYILLVVDIIIIVTVVINYRKLVFISFDEEFARLRGLNVKFYYLMLLSLIAVTIVVLLQTVGIILVIALLTLPPAISAMLVSDMRKMMVYSSILIFLFILAGLALSFYANLPSGASIIVIAGAVYLLAFLIKR